ncbi:MAG TPA: hypothetical protein VHC43_12080 [Mycobacteriales bacterium]|nr:hypothetical protein [Mycobacteriales bacterium]
MNPYELTHESAPETWWPHRPADCRPARPGAETRQVLLTLGAACLVVAFTAGTALVWSQLGPAGQLALMAAATGGLLVGAATVRRLPATAEALAAVGLSGCLVDAVAARTLHVSAAYGLPLHSYITVAALGIGGAAVALGLANRRLVSAPITWATAPLVAAVGIVDPTNPSRAVLLAPVGIGAATGLDWALRRSLPAAASARAVNAAGAAGVAVIGFAAALIAASHHDPVGLWGAALPLALFVLPSLAASPRLVFDDATSALSGIAAGMLLVAFGLHAGVDTRAAAAATLLVLAAYSQLPIATGWLRRGQVAMGLLAYPGVVAWGSTVTDPLRFATVDYGLAIAAAGVAVAWPHARDGAVAIRNAALGSALLLASIAVGITLALHGVTTPEAYVATPAALSLAWGAGLLIHDREMSSVVLAPGLVIGMLPSVVLALGHDHPRQAVLLVLAALVVAIGAELRLATPLVAGATVIGLLSLRLVGPELATLPRWIEFGAVGAVLLTLGATWEARLEDIRRVRGSLRPRIEALR